MRGVVVEVGDGFCDDKAEGEEYEEIGEGWQPFVGQRECVRQLRSIVVGGIVGDEWSREEPRDGDHGGRSRCCCGCDGSCDGRGREYEEIGKRLLVFTLGVVQRDCGFGVSIDSQDEKDHEIWVNSQRERVRT